MLGFDLVKTMDWEIGIEPGPFRILSVVYLGFFLSIQQVYS